MRAKSPIKLAVIMAVCIAGIPVVATALTTISQGYSAPESLALGSIVSLQKNTSDQVVAATPSNASSILGVVISDGNSLLSLSNGQGNQVQVASSGIVQVLVSDINGPITQGDQITASPIGGVGMRATSNAKVVGIAQGDLSVKNGKKQSYTDKEGIKHDVLLGELPLQLNVSYFFKQPEKTIIPSAIQNVANALAGKNVSPLPILISMGIFIVSLISVVSIIYSMIHGSIISVGRNPMSQSAIYRNLVQLSALVAAILGVTVIAIYLVLTRF